MDDVTPKRAFALSNGAYDTLKWIAQILLPALGTMYYGLSLIWPMPKPEEVVATVVVVDTFLGALLGLSNAAYKGSDNAYDGEIRISEGEESDTYSLIMNDYPENLPKKNEATFKIVHPHN